MLFGLFLFIFVLLTTGKYLSCPARIVQLRMKIGESKTFDNTFFNKTSFTSHLKQGTWADKRFFWGYFGTCLGKIMDISQSFFSANFKRFRRTGLRVFAMGFWRPPRVEKPPSPYPSLPRWEKETMPAGPMRGKQGAFR
jgi:hypothetical protein